MGSEQSSQQHEKSNKNETKEICDDGFSRHSETDEHDEHELELGASKASTTFVSSRKHVEDRGIVEGTMYLPSNIQLDSATSIMSPQPLTVPSSTTIISRHVQNVPSFTFKTGSSQCDATVQTNVIAIQETPASPECVCDVSNEERTSHACQNVPHKGPVLLKSEHFSLQKSLSEPYESVSFSSSVVGTQMTQLSPTDPTHPLPLQSALSSSKPIPPFVPFSSTVEINMASKPLHLNSTFATFQPCHGVFSSSITTELSQFTDVPPVPPTAENMCSSKQQTASNLLQESSDLIESDSSRENSNISTCLEQLLSETLKKIIDIDVLLQLLKGENITKKKRKMLCKKMSQLSDNMKVVQKTWGDIIKITNNEALTAKKTVNNSKHQVSEKVQLKSCGKHNTVQNDKSRSVVEVHDEDAMRSYLGEHGWQIVKDTSELNISDNLFYCNICKTKVNGFANVVTHFDGKRHGKELNNCLTLLNIFFIIGDRGHCKLCNTEIPCTLRNMFEHVNGTRHNRKLQEDCTDLKIHAVGEGGEVANYSRQILQNTKYNSQNWQQLACNSLDPLVNTDTVVHPETPARHDQLLAKLIANPSHLLTSKFVGFYCKPCNCFNYGKSVTKHANKSAHLENMKNSEANRILFCGTCKIVLWGNINLLVQHKLSAGHIEIQHLY